MGESSPLFPGKAPIFALPGTVFFPGTRLPLHVFEPRYREMTERALESDRLIAVALLRPGWEADYEGNPPIHEICTVGQIVADDRLEDGRFNILLEGIARFRPESLVQEKPYRIARGKLLGDRLDPVTAKNVPGQALHLAAILNRLAEEDRAFAELSSRLVSAGLPPGRLADVVAAALPVDIALKQALLETVDVAARLSALLAASTHKLEEILRKRREESGGPSSQWN
ncbi:MAG: LON peptidase substrate-binding domain-containing protein [Planctomycetes bacterium]|nr:LON peptidase substrate-binding domain-containing protein [Planctomycetota bacterium]